MVGSGGGRMIVAPVTLEGADRRALIFLAALWIAAIALVNPVGDFPINDDWSYGLAVRSLISRHAWRPTDFTSMPLVAQALWGSLFCLPFGFSFTALRVSTLAIASIGLAGVYCLLRQCGARPATSLLCASAVLTCPMFFALSFTFMTDVPFLALSVWAMVFTLAYQDGVSRGHLAAATALFVAATLVRQFGVGLALAAGVSTIVIAGRRRLGAAAILAITPALVLLGYDATIRWLGEPAYYHRREGELALMLADPRALLKVIATRLMQMFVYAGVLILPVLVGTRPARTRPATTRAIIAIFAVAVGGALVARRHAMPLVGNIWFNLGLNPVVIRGGNQWPMASLALWVPITAVGVLSGAVLASRVIAGAWLARRDIWQTTLNRIPPILIGLALSVGPLLLFNLYDRYLLLPLVLGLALLMLVATSPEGDRMASRQWAAAALCVGMGAFDIAAVHDSLAFNRARWAAVRDLQQTGIPGERIDGGFEVNGWLSYHEGADATEAGAWWAPKAHPAATLSLEPPYAGEVGAVAYRFSRWLPPGQGLVYVRRPRTSE